jgi:hypothetical protein
MRYAFSLPSPLYVILLRRKSLAGWLPVITANYIT